MACGWVGWEGSSPFPPQDVQHSQRAGFVPGQLGAGTTACLADGARCVAGDTGAAHALGLLLFWWHRHLLLLSVLIPACWAAVALLCLVLLGAEEAQQGGGDGCDQQPLLCWRLLLGQSRSAGVTMASPCLQPSSVSQRAATEGSHHPSGALWQRGWSCATQCARQPPGEG